MVTFSEVHVRAEIVFSGITIVTPYILAFNVRRARGQMCATFQASVKIPAGTSWEDTINDEITISAGVNSASNLIFTGYVHEIQINPCREDSDYIIVNISGKDAMFVLQGQRFTRRTESYLMGRFGVITDIVEENEKYAERFPAKVYSAEERLTKHPIMNAEGNIISAPSPSFTKATEGGLVGPDLFVVHNLGSMAGT